MRVRYAICSCLAEMLAAFCIWLCAGAAAIWQADLLFVLWLLAFAFKHMMCFVGMQDEAMQLEDLAQQNERLSADVERLQQVKAQVGYKQAGWVTAATPCSSSIDNCCCVHSMPARVLAATQLSRMCVNLDNTSLSCNCYTQ